VTVIMRMLNDGSVAISTGAMDIGTGTKTVACMVAAEELKMPMERIRIENADTDTTPYCIGSGGSRTLPSLIPAVRRAAYQIKRQLLDWAAEDLGTSSEELELRNNAVVSKLNAEIKRPVSELINAKRQWEVVGVGYRGPNPEGKIIRTFAVHFAEVEVNMLTGEVRVVRMLGANESGRVINRKTFDNQVFGGMVQGIGYGLIEKRVIDRQTGKLLTANLSDFKVPTSMDVPVEHEVLAIDPHDTECNIVGCKGLGEPATIPTSAAIANAVYDAIGVRIFDGPIDPPRVLEALRRK
jgi:CO/xanthine dehydrogenase Mo-binding subunit